MSYEVRAYLRNNATGFVFRVRYSVPDSLDMEESREGDEFSWTEGNLSCDCNRALFYARATGADDPQDPPCGDRRFDLVALVGDDGATRRNLLSKDEALEPAFAGEHLW